MTTGNYSVNMIETPEPGTPVTFRIDADTIARLDEMARRTFRKRSDLLRLAVENLLENGAEIETGKEGK